VKLAPWDYLFVKFDSVKFHDLFYPTWILSLIFLVLLIVLYNVRTRQLHRHPPYLDMYEWLLWTGVITFSLLIMYSLFVFYFLFVLITLVIALAVLVWIRFIHFPPILAAYQARLAQQRDFTRLKYAHPESTIRSKGSKAVRTAGAGKPVRRRRR
jgi:hypothetical protein